MKTHQSGDYKGLGFGVSAFILFSFMPIYVQQLKPLSGYTLLNQRILWSTLLLLVGLSLIKKLSFYLRPMRQLKAWPGLIAGSLLVGLQWGLFVWAPLNQHTLDLSLGYFLVPLVMVFIGKVFLGEKLRPLQWVAMFCASAGVLMAFWKASDLSWVAILVAVGYPLYLVLRRKQVLPTVSAFLIENLILLPPALIGILMFGGLEGESLSHPFAYSSSLVLLFLGLAIMGSVPMLCFIAANNRLNMITLGLLSYLEPALIFVVAYVFLGETLKADDLFIYGPIIFGLGILAIDGGRQIIRKKHTAKNSYHL